MPHHRCGDAVFFAWLQAFVQGREQSRQGHSVFGKGLQIKLKTS